MMKKIIKIVVAAFISATAIVSCEKEPVPYVSKDGTPHNYYVSVIDSSIFHTIDDLVLYIAQSNGDELGLSKYLLESLYSGEINEILLRNYVDVGINDDGTPRLKFERYNFTYNSVDALGNPVVLSAAVIFPNNTENTTRDYELDNITLFSNYGLSRNSSCATESGSAAMLRVLFSSMVVIPDFQGYGVSYGMRHPYYESTTLARQAIDCELAAIELAKEKGVGLWRDYVTYNMGVGNGGLTALAVQKKLETSEPSAVKSLIRLSSTYCANAPLDMNAFFSYFAGRNLMAAPQTFAQAINGIYYSHSKIFTEYKLSDFTSDNFNNTVLSTSQGMYSFHSLIESLKFDPVSTSALFITNKMYNGKKILSNRVYNGFTSEVSDPLVDLIKLVNDSNNPTLNWTPSTPVLIEHSKLDDYYPYEASFKAYENIRYTAGGAENNLVNFNTLYIETHTAASVEAMLKIALKRDPLNKDSN